MRCMKCDTELKENLDICPGCSLPLTQEIFKKNIGYPNRTGWISFFAIFYWISAGFTSLSAIVLIVSGKTAVVNIEPSILIIAALVDAALFFWCAFGLWHLKNYGRKIILIFAYVQLIAFPIGTVIGILIIRYFIKPEIKALFSEEKFKMLSKEQIMKLTLKIERSPKTVTIILLTSGLYLVLTLLFTLLFLVMVPEGFLKGRTNPYIVSVGGDKIRVIEYEKQLVMALQNYRRQFKDNFNKKLVTQLRIPDQILNNMIHSKVIRAEADKLNITAPKNELKERIINYPAFQQDGKFIGIENVKRILAYQRMDLNEFEDHLKQEIITNKLRERVTASLEIDEETLKEKFKEEKDKVELEYILLNPDRVSDKIEVKDLEITNYYQKNKDDFKSPERREARVESLEKVKDRVKHDAIQAKKVERLIKEARAITADLNRMKHEKEIKKFLKDKDLSADTTTYRRGNKLSYLPVKKRLDDLIFSLEEKQYSAPIDFKTVVAIVKVKSKKVTSAADFEKEKKEFYAQKLNQSKIDYFNSYILNKREAYNVQINQELYQKVNDQILAMLD